MAGRADYTFNARTDYAFDLAFCDGVQNCVLQQRDGEQKKTGKTCAGICLKTSVADSEIATIAISLGFNANDTVIAFQRVSGDDFLPKSKDAIELDGVTWVVQRAIERTPGPVHDCICGVAGKLDPGIL